MPRKGIAIRTVLVLAAVAAVVAVSATGASATRMTLSNLSGAGSTFVQPLVDRWITPVKKNLSINLSYNGVGSGGGVTAISTRQVDMGMSDAPLSQFNPTCTTCVQMPWALAGTAVVYNLGISGLKLSGPVLANIYLCNITNWDDPAIQALNPGKNLPNLTIHPVHRTDSSGTTYNFTDYLSNVSNNWQTGPGTGTAPGWPGCGGNALGGSHSSGMSQVVKGQKGAIGYVDVDYAKVNALKYFAMKNEAGNFIKPTLGSIKAASNSDTSPNGNGVLSIVDPSSSFPNAYPICTYTYVDVQQSGNGSQTTVIKHFLKWAITNGQNYGPALLFVPLPKGVVTWDQHNAIPNIGS